MSVGPWQILLILVIVLIIFGAGKLPRVMGDLAKGIKNFKSGMKEEIETADSKPEPASKPAEKEITAKSTTDAEVVETADKETAAKG